MKKTVKIILVMMMAMMLLVGCAKTEEAVVVETKDVETEAVIETEAEAESMEEVEEVIIEEVTPITIKVAAPSGAPTLSMIKMFKEEPVLGEGVEVIYESVKSPDLMAAKIISGEVDFAIVPSNLAIKLYNKEVDYKYAASSIWGVLYVVSTEEISGWEDLRGKEINMIGRGLTPDVVLRFLLKENGLEPDVDVTFNYVNGGTELAQMFIAGESTLSIMPEPVLSKVLMKKEDATVVLDLQEEWSKVSDGTESYPQAGLVVSSALVESHPEVVEAFLAKYEESITWVNENPAEAGVYGEELEIGLAAKITENAIGRSNMEYKSALDSKESLTAYYEILFGFSPELVGGELPDDAFFLNN